MKIEVIYTEKSFDGINEVSVEHTKYFNNVTSFEFVDNEPWIIISMKNGDFEPFNIYTLVSIKVVE